MEAFSSWAEAQKYDDLLTGEAYDQQLGSFTDHESDMHTLDGQILRDGGISLYLSPALLEDDLKWLRSHAYEIRELDSGSWISQTSMHEALASALSFAAYYGNNFDVLHECMSQDLAVPRTGGFVLALRRFDRFATAIDIARTLLNILAIASRYHMLSGRRFILLIQSDDPSMSFTGLGGVNAEWNRKEWL